MKLFRTLSGLVAELQDGTFRALDLDLDALFTSERPIELAEERAKTAAVVGLSETARLLAPPKTGQPLASPKTGQPLASPEAGQLLAPLESQEVWAAGVTYIRSRTARMAESEDAGGGSFYDRVYTAERPEIFFKATPSRVTAPGGPVRVRADSKWSVPEPELALAVSSSGSIFGYTVGNDMSARDIEGENPLYLPQAKVYAGCCALGPGLLLSADPPPPETEIRLAIRRGADVVFEGSTALGSMKRTPQELVEFLFRENTFPTGCYLLTGTGIVPPDEFTLASGDAIAITIDPIGTLENFVA